MSSSGIENLHTAPSCFWLYFACTAHLKTPVSFHVVSFFHQSDARRYAVYILTVHLFKYFSRCILGKEMIAMGNAYQSGRKSSPQFLIPNVPRDLLLCSRHYVPRPRPLLSQTLSVFLDPNVPRPFIPKSQLYVPRPFVPRHYTPLSSWTIYSKGVPSNMANMFLQPLFHGPYAARDECFLGDFGPWNQGPYPYIRKSPHCNYKLRHGRCKIFPL